MARNEPMIRFRLPEGLKARLETAHEANGRSMNAEIRMRLEWSFQEGFDGAASNEALANEIETLRAELRVGLASLKVEVDQLKKRHSS